VKSNAEMFRLSTRPDAVTEANQRLFERECARAGIDPSRGVSPGLAAQLQPQIEQQKLTRDEEAA